MWRFAALYRKWTYDVIYLLEDRGYEPGIFCNTMVNFCEYKMPLLASRLSWQIFVFKRYLLRNKTWLSCIPGIWRHLTSTWQEVAHKIPLSSTGFGIFVPQIYPVLEFSFIFNAFLSMHIFLQGTNAEPQYWKFLNFSFVLYCYENNIPMHFYCHLVESRVQVSYKGVPYKKMCV